MDTIYVTKRSGLTEAKKCFEFVGWSVYNTRINCSCQAPQNRRNGLIAIKGEKVKFKAIQCKSCAKGGVQ